MTIKAPSKDELISLINQAPNNVITLKLISGIFDRCGEDYSMIGGRLIKVPCGRDLEFYQHNN